MLESDRQRGLGTADNGLDLQQQLTSGCTRRGRTARHAGDHHVISFDP
jgi:hypothetical protein